MIQFIWHVDVYVVLEWRMMLFLETEVKNGQF